MWERKRKCERDSYRLSKRETNSNLSNGQTLLKCPKPRSQKKHTLAKQGLNVRKRKWERDSYRESKRERQIQIDQIIKLY